MRFFQFHLRLLQASLIVTTTLIFPGCSEEGEFGPFPEVTNLKAIDLSNEGNSSDIHVRFNLSFQVETIRIVIIPSNGLSDFGTSEATNLDASAYMELPFVNQLDYMVDMDEITDTSGNAVAINRDYNLKIIVINNGDLKLLDETIVIRLGSLNPLIGDYVGTWDDNFYTDFGISVRINSEISGTLKGELFYTPTFTPCCDGASAGAVNDGTVSFELGEGNTVTAFRYDQVLLTYMGGCPGTYDGSGTHTNLTFDIDYSGDDCDGTHVGGKIKLARVF